MSDPAVVLAAASQALDRRGLPHMVIGGMAVIQWGEARTTRDIDITVLVADDQIDTLVAAIGDFGSPRVSDPSAFALANRVIPSMTHDGVPVDLILATLPFEEAAIERAVPVRIGDADVPHVSPQDLIVHKIVSTRAIDQHDVEGILARQKDLDLVALRVLVEALASDLSEPEILERFDRAVRAS